MIAVYIFISFVVGVLLGAKVYKTMVENEVKKENDKLIENINKQYVQLLDNITTGLSKFKSRVNSTVHIESTLQDHGNIDIIYLLDKNDVAIFQNNKCLYTSDKADKHVISDIAKAIDHLYKREISEVVNFFGLVLSKQGGALAKLETPVSLFLGAPLGSGKQWMPWIHVTDLLAVFEKAIENSKLDGTYNACSPIPVTNLEFTKILAKTLFRPVWPIKVPEFILKAVLGEMSEVVLISNHTTSQKLINSGFKFRYAGLDEALKEIYSH